MYADVAQLICESAGNIQVNSTSKPSNNYQAARLTMWQSSSSKWHSPRASFFSLIRRTEWVRCIHVYSPVVSNVRRASP